MDPWVESLEDFVTCYVTMLRTMGAEDDAARTVIEAIDDCVFDSIVATDFENVFAMIRWTVK